MNPIQVIMDFFKELLNRIKTKSPFFFKILMVFAACLCFLGYLPSALQEWFRVEVPGKMITICENIAKFAMGFFAASGISAKPDVVGQTEGGLEVKVTDHKKMPLTAKAEQREVAKKVPPPEILDVPESSEESKTGT